MCIIFHACCKHQQGCCKTKARKQVNYTQDNPSTKSCPACLTEGTSYLFVSLVTNTCAARRGSPWDGWPETSGATGCPHPRRTQESGELQVFGYTLFIWLLIMTTDSARNGLLVLAYFVPYDDYIRSGLTSHHWLVHEYVCCLVAYLYRSAKGKHCAHGTVNTK